MNQISDLFRKEAISYRLNRQRSENQLPRSANFGLTFWALIVLLTLLIIVMFRVQYRETESARGRVISTEAELQLVAPRTGLLQQLLVSSGDNVSAGQVLAVISLSVFSPEGQAVSIAERKILEQKLDGAKEQRALVNERHSLASDKLNADIVNQRRHLDLVLAHLESLHNQIEISQSLLSASNSLLESGSISVARYKQQEMEHLNLVRARNLAEQETGESRTQLANLLTKIESDSVEQAIAISQIDQNILSLAQQLSAEKNEQEVAVLAQRDGFVSTVVATEGDAVATGQTLIYLQPDNQSLIAEIYVPSSIVARLYEGQEVLLRYDAFDFHTYGRYSASIEEIGRSALDPREHLLPIPVQAEPVFPVLVKPNQHYVEGQDVYPLQSGLLLNADFIAAEMSLIQFILKPVLNLRGKLA